MNKHERLAELFWVPRQARPEERAKILQDFVTARSFGLHENTVGVLTQGGRLFIDRCHFPFLDVLHVDYFPAGSRERLTFSALDRDFPGLPRLMTREVCRVPYMTILQGGAA